MKTESPVNPPAPLSREEGRQQRKLAESRARLRAAAALAELGSYRCGGRCRKVKPMKEGLVVTWGGNILFGICPECFPASPVVMRRKLADGQESVWVGPLKEEDRPPDILPVSSMLEVKDSPFISLLSRREPGSLLEEDDE